MDVYCCHPALWCWRREGRQDHHIVINYSDVGTKVKEDAGARIILTFLSVSHDHMFHTMV